VIAGDMHRKTGWVERKDGNVTVHPAPASTVMMRVTDARRNGLG
jgi:hypothetical protein